ncbi:HEAT repeat domain-containing protein [Candidatus Binatia bacterium]|nr:HEAT repeat domain-containing protein [Candidatus Binatia bacterium]
MPRLAPPSSLVALLVTLAGIAACSSEAPTPDPAPTAVRAPGTTPNGVAMQLSQQLKDLGSRNDAVAVAAIDALVAQGPAALDVVTPVFEQGSETARENALEVLKELELPDSVPLLVKVLGRDDDPDVRYETAILLGQLADPRAREVIEATLRDREWTARTGAARACATLCTSPEAVDRLVWMAIFDQPVQPGIWARSSLVKMLKSSAAAPAPADPPGQVRAAIERAAKPAASGTGSLETRVRAALLLSDIGDTSGIPALREAVAQQGLDAKVMPYPLFVLGQIGDASDVPALSAALANPRPEVSAFAYDALRRLAAKNQPGAAEAMAGFQGPKPAKELKSPLP